MPSPSSRCCWRCLTSTGSARTWSLSRPVPTSRPTNRPTSRPTSPWTGAALRPPQAAADDSPADPADGVGSCPSCHKAVSGTSPNALVRAPYWAARGPALTPWATNGQQDGPGCHLDQGGHLGRAGLQLFERHQGEQHGRESAWVEPPHEQPGDRSQPEPEPEQRQRDGKHPAPRSGPAPRSRWPSRTSARSAPARPTGRRTAFRRRTTRTGPRSR